MPYNKSLLIASLLLSAASFNAQAALTSYTGANGVNLVYDNVTNLTWTKDANLLGSLETAQGYTNLVNAIVAASPVIKDTANLYDTSSYSGYHTVSAADFSSTSLGLASWFGAQAFMGYLNSINYGGSNQWALPSAGSNPDIGYNRTGTAFGELFYSELGGTIVNPIPNTATFDNEQAYAYWLGTEYAPIPNTEFAPFPEDAWGFRTSDGGQVINSKDRPFYAWAVSPGEVSAVPVPGAVWLMGSGLLGLLSLKRRGHAG
jgi:hypothetical protein